METKPMPEELPARWRERAEYLRQFGDTNCAKLWELAASELEAALQISGKELLTLGQAAKLSGLTPDYIGELIRTGKLKNYGREGAPLRNTLRHYFGGEAFAALKLRPDP